MPRDFENLHDLEDLDDDELRRLVREHLHEHRGLDANEITVHVRGRAIRLSGRVGTEGESRVAERVVTDTLGLTNVVNEIIVDQIRRPETSEDIEVHLAQERSEEGLLLGDRPPEESDEAHLARGDDDADERLYGTTDVQDSIAHGTTWVPPEGPTQEGSEG